MKRPEVPLPEIGLIAATRGMLGAGIGLLVGDHIDPRRRSKVGLGLVLLGAISTIPLVYDIWRRVSSDRVDRNRDETKLKSKWNPRTAESLTPQV